MASQNQTKFDSIYAHRDVLDAPVEMEGDFPGTTTLRKKIAYFAHNFNEILQAVLSIFDVKVELHGNHGTDKTHTTLRTTLGWVAHHFRTITEQGKDILSVIGTVLSNQRIINEKLDAILAGQSAHVVTITAPLTEEKDQ